MPQKLVLLGLDAPIVESVERFVGEGVMPNFARLMKNGTFAENCLVPYPTITPPNWTTLVTGAWPGTHTITCFHRHNPGEALDKVHQAFDSRECAAEYLWEAAEKVGKRSIVFNYPSSWPSTLQDGILVGGVGLGINEWRVGNEVLCSVAADQVFATEEMAGAATVIKLEPARAASGAGGAGEWAAQVPEGSLEAELRFAYRRAKAAVQPKSWWLLLPKGEGGFERVEIYRSKAEGRPVCVLRAGEWSGTLEETFETEEGGRAAIFRACLEELTPGGEKLRLYFTHLCAREGWAWPGAICQELREVEGLPLPDNAYQTLSLGWIEARTFVEVNRLQIKWYAEAARRLMASQRWDLFFMHAHTPDWLYHAIMRELDPLTTKGKQQEEFAYAERECYRLLDEMIGDIVEAAGERALVVIVSDHGAKSSRAGVNLAEVLKRAGLWVTRKDEEGRERTDWTRTKAVTQRSCYVYVNLKGRDPQGIVEPGEEYEQVREEVIRAFMTYVDPKTGVCPFVMALRKEDARMIGLYGDYVGDVVFALRADYEGEHGRQLPTARYGMGSLKGLLLLSGPGIKRGYRMKRTAWLTDVVPTVCHLLELPLPKEAEGGVLYQALEDPDAKRKELLRLRDHYARVKAALEQERALEHRYED